MPITIRRFSKLIEAAQALESYAQAYSRDLRTMVAGQNFPDGAAALAHQAAAQGNFEQAYSHLSSAYSALCSEIPEYHPPLSALLTLNEEQTKLHYSRERAAKPRANLTESTGTNGDFDSHGLGRGKAEGR